MRKAFAIALMSVAVVSVPAVAASHGAQQLQGSQTQPRNANRQPDTAQNRQMNRQQSAQNQSNNRMSPQNLSRREVRDVQQALDKDGFKAGRVDGRWGPETQGALKQFQQSKQLPSNGQLDRQTVADLGLNKAEFESGANANNQQQPGNVHSQPQGGSASNK